MPLFWGKYRGEVMDNVDPLERGRIIAAVPSVLGEVVTAWAMPCLPYAGPKVGLCMAPPIGAAVWIEFEGGDPDYPIWSGCFWRAGERPAAAALPTTRMIQTDAAQLLFNDIEGAGGFTLSVGAPAVEMPVSIVANAQGLKITMAEISIAVTQLGVTITASPASAAVLTGGVTIKHGAAVVSLVEPAVAINGGALTVE